MEKLTRWPYLFRHKNETLYYVRRVPIDLCDDVGERQIRRSLKVRDERRPEAKASYDAVHREVESLFAGLRNGENSDQARATFGKAVVLAQRKGFAFRPMADLVENASIDELIRRLNAIEKKVGDRNSLEVDAVVGAFKEPTFRISHAVERYIELSRNDLRGKNENQRRRWVGPLRRAVQNFIRVVDDKDLSDITRDDALTFREWWVTERIGTDVITSNAANKELMHLRKIFRAINDAHRLNLDNPFANLNIKGDDKIPQVSISREHLESVLLLDGALSGLNSQARGVVKAMADTGARVNEITGLEPDDIVLEHKTPHIQIQANENRSLKTRHSRRKIPLVDVALRAMQENPNGFPRYAGKNASASAAINKYLRDHELLPDGATLYGLRHGFQDRLIEVEAPERIQADLMGHKTLRPKYGKGPSLEQMRDWLLMTALQPN